MIRTEPARPDARPAAMPLRPARRVALLAIALVAIAGCQLVPASVVGPTLPPGLRDPFAVAGPGDVPLVTVVWIGGLCPEGTCESGLTITHGGVRHDLRPGGPPPAPVDGAALGRLAAAIGAADFDALRSVPFEGDCPIAVDGQELHYTFHVPTGPIMLSSCSVAIDTAAPPFRELYEVLFPS